MSILPFLYAQYSILTPHSNTEKIFTLSVSPVESTEPQPDEVIMCVDAVLNCIHLTDCRCLEGFS